ncbi:MAG: TonB-dependent receptor [Chitinophagaceae bacterium]
MKQLLLTAVVLQAFIAGFSQEQNTDTTKNLSEVIVKAYEQNRQLKQTSAAINFISEAQLQRYGNANILPALNNTPGARMEERSPGSYRLNLRGSTLRSPFGVRNVKIYWDGIPLTDPGGNTYLNQLSFYNINSLEVIKGPGGSLYGAGTGGVILIHSQPETWQPGASVSYLAGSYGLSNFNAQAKFGTDERNTTVNYSRLTSDGYRDHTAMRRDVITWQSKLKSTEKQELSASVLYGDMYYQTPGALTKAEYTANARAARPAAGAFLSADQVKAAIYQKTFLAGITNEYHFTSDFENVTTIYGAFSQIRNPTFRNYERRMEPHFGGRTAFKWNHQFNTSTLQFVVGSEAQKGFFSTKTYKNNFGVPDSLLTDDDINIWTYSVFGQADLQLPHDWNLTAGVSLNKSSITITRLSVPSFVPVNSTYSNEWAPRIALSKRLVSNLWIYGSVSKGFSPPMAQEVLPSTSVISLGLQAEHGVNYEAGIKSSWLQQRLYVEINAFYYQLKNAIVSRKDASNADYYTNAGSTKQRGIESQVSYQLFEKKYSFLNNARISVSNTLNKFNYNDFKQSTTDFSGKKMPSVSPNTFTAALDLVTKPGVYINLSYFYSDPIPLNDANSDFATSYNLLGGRIGWKKLAAKKLLLDFAVGADNLFDVKYSLGNDINATGGRYYNVAPGRNFYGGVTVSFLCKKRD